MVAVYRRAFLEYVTDDDDAILKFRKVAENYPDNVKIHDDPEYRDVLVRVYPDEIENCDRRGRTRRAFSFPGNMLWFKPRASDPEWKIGLTVIGDEPVSVVREGRVIAPYRADTTDNGNTRRKFSGFANSLSITYLNRDGLVVTETPLVRWNHTFENYYIDPQRDAPRPLDKVEEDGSRELAAFIKDARAYARDGSSHSRSQEPTRFESAESAGASESCEETDNLSPAPDSEDGGPLPPSPDITTAEPEESREDAREDDDDDDEGGDEDTRALYMEKLNDPSLSLSRQSREKIERALARVEEKLNKQ